MQWKILLKEHFLKQVWHISIDNKSLLCVCVCLFKYTVCILIDCRYQIYVFKDSQCINHDVHQCYAGVFTVPCCLQYREIVKQEALYNGVRRTEASFQPYYLLTEHLVKLFKLSKSFFPPFVCWMDYNIYLLKNVIK